MVKTGRKMMKKLFHGFVGVNVGNVAKSKPATESQVTNTTGNTSSGYEVCALETLGKRGLRLEGELANGFRFDNSTKEGRERNAKSKRKFMRRFLTTVVPSSAVRKVNVHVRDGAEDEKEAEEYAQRLYRAALEATIAQERYEQLLLEGLSQKNTMKIASTFYENLTETQSKSQTTSDFDARTAGESELSQATASEDEIETVITVPLLEYLTLPIYAVGFLIKMFFEMLLMVVCLWPCAVFEDTCIKAIYLERELEVLVTPKIGAERYRDLKKFCHEWAVFIFRAWFYYHLIEESPV